MIEFQPDQGAPSYAITETDGHFQMQYQKDRPGALLGHHVIRVRTLSEFNDPVTDETVIVDETIPRSYNDESQLEFTVTKGRNTYDIDIEGDR